MNLFKKISASLFLVFFLGMFFVPVFSYAQGTGPAPSVSEKVKNPLGSKFENLNSFVKGLLEGIIKILIPVIALAIIYAGLLFVTANGNTEKLTTAKNALLYAAIGAGLILGAWALSILISETVIQLGTGV